MAGLIGHYFLSGTGAPTTPPVLYGEWGWYQDDATGDLYQWIPDRATWVLLGLAAIDFPRRATLWHDQALFTSGTRLITQDALQNYLVRVNTSSPANGDSWTHAFFLEHGTYTLSVLGLTAPDAPKLDWAIDGVTVASGQDWYHASTAVYNVIQTASVTVTGDGYHVLRGTVNGKNASSSGYSHSLTKYWLAPSAD